MLKEYTEAFGVSGCEKEIRELIKKNTSALGDIKIDTMGNLMVHKAEGKGKRVMLAAHMDEVGFIVSAIKADGRIMFKTVGGIDPRILISKRVIFGRNKVRGVIGTKPIHLLSDEEIGRPIEVKQLFIEIGAESREEALKYIRLGDYAVFESDYVDMGKVIKAKALDDRVGCAILTEVLKGDYNNIDMYGAFTVQEENGLRGAKIAAYTIEPEIAIIIEGTTCADSFDKNKGHVTSLGKGPALSILDSTSSANGRLFKRIADTAEKNNIPFQYRRGTMGGNDAGAIHMAKEGCITATISVPTRYIHSPVSIIDKNDYENTLELVKLVLKSLEEEGL